MALGPVLVEQFMPGVEMSVEAFVVGGELHVVATSDKIRTEPPYLLDKAVLFPSQHPAEIQLRAGTIVAAAVEALGIDHAVIHAEVMITPQGPVMIELAARGPGFKVFTDMIPWSSGVDVVKALIRMAVGESPNVEAHCQRGAVLRFVEAPPGRVVRLEGVEDAKAVRGVHDLQVYVGRGDVVRSLTSGSDRIGHVITLGETRAEAVASASAAIELVRIVTEPHHLGAKAACCHLDS